LAQQPVELGGFDVHAITQDSTVNCQRLGYNFDLPAFDHGGRQAGAAIYNNGYLALGDQ
jgi:hypothetical protein